MKRNILILVAAVLFATRLDAQLWVTDGTASNAHEYNASSGAVVTNFNVSGATNVLASSGTVDFLLGNGSVAQYTTSGSFISNLITQSSSLYIDLLVSGTDMFLLNGANGSSTGGFIKEYNANTGALINSTFVTGLTISLAGNMQMAISGNNLFIGNNSTGAIDEYNATTGALVTSGFIPSSFGDTSGIAVSGSLMFVADDTSANVGKFNANTGATINANFLTGILNPDGMVVSGTDLYVMGRGNATNGTGFVREYNVSTGTVISSTFVTGLSNARGISLVVVPEPSSLALLAFGAAGGYFFLRRRKVYRG